MSHERGRVLTVACPSCGATAGQPCRQTAPHGLRVAALMGEAIEAAVNLAPGAPESAAALRELAAAREAYDALVSPRGGGLAWAVDVALHELRRRRRGIQRRGLGGDPRWTDTLGDLAATIETLEQFARMLEGV